MLLGHVCGLCGLLLPRCALLDADQGGTDFPGGLDAVVGQALYADCCCINMYIIPVACKCFRYRWVSSGTILQLMVYLLSCIGYCVIAAHMFFFFVLGSTLPKGAAWYPCACGGVTFSSNPTPCKATVTSRAA